MREIDLAWMAGLFIGEGHVKPLIRKSKSSERVWSCIYLDIAMTDKETIRKFGRFCDSLAGGRRPISTRKGTGNRKDLYRYQIGGKGAEKVLEAMAPFMKGSEKMAQAVEALRKTDAARVDVTTCPNGHPPSHRRRNSEEVMECWTCKLRSAGMTDEQIARAWAKKGKKIR